MLLEDSHLGCPCFKNHDLRAQKIINVSYDLLPNYLAVNAEKPNLYYLNKNTRKHLSQCHRLRFSDLKPRIFSKTLVSTEQGLEIRPRVEEESLSGDWVTPVRYQTFKYSFSRITIKYILYV